MAFGVKFEEKPPVEKGENSEEGTENGEEGKTNEPTTQTELNDDVILSYLKEKKGKEVSSLDDLFKEKVVEKNPYEDILDDYDKNYLNFKKETGRGRKEFEFLQNDFSKKSVVELAYDKVRKQTGKDLTNEQAKEYLLFKNKIEFFDEEDLDTNTQIELESYVKDYRDEMLSLQEKYKTPTEEHQFKNQEMVTLDNGQKVLKEYYDNITKQRNEYLKNLQTEVSSATSIETVTSFDDNGENKELKFSYELNDDDKHSMLSNASDLDAFVSNKFKSEDGFKYKEFAQFIDKAENFDKYIGLAMQQARAEAIEEYIAKGNNENFNRKPLPKNKGEEGYGDFISGKGSAFGVKF